MILLTAFRHTPLLLALVCALFLPEHASAAAARKPHARPASQTAAKSPNYAKRADVLKAADDIARQTSLNPTWVRHMLANARYIPAIAKAIAPAPTGVAKNWQAYRSRFVEPRRIDAGVRFWRANQETLSLAEAQTGVPPEIIVGILGVETLYGQHMGNFRVLDALATLAFDFPASHPRAAERSAYFRGELGQYLSLTHRQGIDPASLRGSYAGAMGLPQFMPSSWQHYAVDFDHDGRTDLFKSTVDAIGSVANYFKSYGWQSGQPTHFSVHFDSERLDLDTLTAPDILPTFSAARFRELGAQLEDKEAQTYQGKLALVELQNGDEAPSFVAGTDNFYVITRYNWSSYYAMAVIELGQAVKQAVTDATR